MPTPAASISGDRSLSAPPDTLAERSLTWAFLLLLAAAVLLRAGDTPWSWTLLAGLTGILLLVWGLAAMFGSHLAPAALRPLWPALVLYAGVVLWAGTQGIAGAPEGWRPALWGHAAGLLDTQVAGSLSLDPERSLAGAVRLLCYGGVFLIAFQLAHARHRAMRILRWLVVVGLVCAGYGLLIDFTGLDVAYWPKNPRNFGNLTSTFPERNVFASYAGMILIAAASLLFRPKVRADDLSAGRRVAVRIFLEYFFTRSMVSIAAAGMLFCAVLLSHSRAGLAASMIGVGVFLITVTRSWQNRRSMLVTVFAVCAGAAAILLVGGGKTMDRMASAPKASAERGEIYRLTAEAIAEAPMMGTGYGTFKNAFPAHRSETLRSPPAHGHNIYLENALELGVPAAAALIAAVGWIGFLCLRRVRASGRESFFPSMGVATIVLIALHSLGDSTLRTPAVAITFATLLGIAVSQTLAPADDTGDGSREAQRSTR